MDDATSSLDMETEYGFKALRKRRDVTKFIIAHRISAVKDADEILVIDQGEIVNGAAMSRCCGKGQVLPDLQ